MRLSLKVLAAAGAVVFLAGAAHCASGPAGGKRTGHGFEEPPNKRREAPQPASDLLNDLLENALQGLGGLNVDYHGRWNTFSNRLTKISNAFAAAVLEAALGAQSPVVKQLVSEIKNDFQEWEYLPTTARAASLDASSKLAKISNAMGVALSNTREHFERLGTIVLNPADDETATQIGKKLYELFSFFIMDQFSYERGDFVQFPFMETVDSLEGLLDQLPSEQALKISELLWGVMKTLNGLPEVTHCPDFTKVSLMTLKYLVRQNPPLRMRDSKEFFITIDGALKFEDAALRIAIFPWGNSFEDKLSYMEKNFQQDLAIAVERVTEELAFRSRVVSLLTYPGVRQNLIKPRLFEAFAVRELGRRLAEFGLLCYQQKGPVNCRLNRYKKIYQEMMLKLKTSFEQAAPLSDSASNGKNLMDKLRTYYPDLPEDDD